MLFSNKMIHLALTAARNGQIKELNLFPLNSESVLEISDMYGATVVHYAARNADKLTLQYLVETFGISANHPTLLGSLPIHEASAVGSLECVKYFVEIDRSNLHVRDSFGHTVWHLCVRYGHVDVLRWLQMQENGSVLRNHMGVTPLHIACEVGNLDAVRELLADTSRLADQDDNETCLCCHQDVVSNQQMICGSTPMFIACQAGHLDVLEHLVTKGGGSLKLLTHDGMSCLHAASQSGHLDIVKWLVTTLFVQSRQISVDEHDYNGSTALHFASSQGHDLVVDWLIKEGGALIKNDSLGGTPLHSAAQHGQFKCLKLLLAGGCSLTHKDLDGMTAADLAEIYDQSECAIFLRRARLNRSNRMREIRKLKSRESSNTSQEETGHAPDDLPNPPYPPTPPDPETMNRRPRTLLLRGESLKSQPDSSDSSTTQQRSDLLEELKSSNGVQSLKRATKTHKGSSVFYGASTPTRIGTPPSSEDDEFHPRRFLDKVPSKDAGGAELPAWRRHLLARQLAERAQQEAAEKHKIAASYLKRLSKQRICR